MGYNNKKIIKKNLAHKTLKIKLGTKNPLANSLLDELIRIDDQTKHQYYDGYFKNHLGYTPDQNLSLIPCHCHNCGEYFKANEIKWKYNKTPVCAKFPICPSPYAEHDIWINVKSEN